MRLKGTVYSQVLENDSSISIVTPNNLNSDKPYNVVYLLHGLKGDSASWLDYSMLPAYAMGVNTIYIMPDAGHSFYVDMKQGFRYFTYITEELPEICRNVFNITSERENTAIMGCSMGGYGALRCALMKPEQYGKCAAFSSGCLFIKENMQSITSQGIEEAVKLFGRQLLTDITSAFGSGLEWKPEYELTELAKHVKERGIIPELYLTCGTEDHFHSDHEKFRKVLDEIGIPYDYEEWQANHTFDCFNEALLRAITKFKL